MEDTLNFQFKPYIDLKHGNNALSFHYRDLYVFSNTNFPIKDIREKHKITIDPIFTTISSIIAPRTQDARLPALTDFKLVDEDEASTSLAPRLSYTETEMWIVNQQTLPRILSFSTAL